MTNNQTHVYVCKGLVSARRRYKFDIKFNFSGFQALTFILFDFTLHRQLVCQVFIEDAECTATRCNFATSFAF